MFVDLLLFLYRDLYVTNRFNTTVSIDAVSLPVYDNYHITFSFTIICPTFNKVQIYFLHVFNEFKLILRGKCRGIF